jgi:hypothetical protein
VFQILAIMFLGMAPFVLLMRKPKGGRAVMAH